MTARPFFLRSAFAWAGLHGAVAVALGAFAAHGMTDPDAIGWVETGSQYQLIHAAALAALGAAAGQGRADRWLNLAAAAFALGPILFSGALYGLAFTPLRILGAVAPIGGTAMILGWLALAVSALTARRPAG